MLLENAFRFLDRLELRILAGSIGMHERRGLAIGSPESLRTADDRFDGDPLAVLSDHAGGRFDGHGAVRTGPCDPRPSLVLFSSSCDPIPIDGPQSLERQSDRPQIV